MRITSQPLHTSDTFKILALDTNSNSQGTAARNALYIASNGILSFLPVVSKYTRHIFGTMMCGATVFTQKYVYSLNPPTLCVAAILTSYLPDTGILQLLISVAVSNHLLIDLQQLLLSFHTQYHMMSNVPFDHL